MRTLTLSDADFANLRAAVTGYEHLSNLLNQAGIFTPATEEQIAAARDEYGSDDIQIDSDAQISEADDGYWVQAWVWIDAPEEEEDDDR